ncbi:uncharacterized protein BT62DRAFT_929178 [Guyanagaster necrorhizus]|uniref:Uncharacterized protein n=1 Tax=Guyanagaster necrorhizus TaxID=856835 RepID=A0A9P7VYC4_9AGAR|nr:uncharacterized protein BT62DRAFT_929178 [Guyanagaster necrorhizus MCA 3950]KAG7449199.1 hypothetical protein BT62DRAFT_929178 [Guyanagaster necrorhizus MCA 3950]
MHLQTDYSAFVLQILRSQPNTIDQSLLRHCIGLSSSYLVTDTTTASSQTAGLQTWYLGFSRLVDVVVALHLLGSLELETVNAASKACSECWTVAGSWKGLETGREHVREVAGKLKRLLDENGRTYRGERVYAP